MCNAKQRRQRRRYEARFVQRLVPLVMDAIEKETARRIRAQMPALAAHFRAEFSGDFLEPVGSKSVPTPPLPAVPA